MNRFVIYKMVSPTTPKPYRIADIFMTLDGPRTRLSTLCFDTQEKAQDFIDRRHPHPDFMGEI